MLRLLCSALIIALAIGCGGDSTPAETTYKVTGKVTLHGSPLEGALVSFAPLDGQRSAAGVTDSEGMYSLRTYKPGDGAVLGRYTIVINKTEVADNSGGDESLDHESAEEAGLEHSSGSGGSVSLIPAKYSNRDSSPFTEEVKKEGPNEFNFDLK